MAELKGTSLDILKENLKKMKQYFPEAFEEGKINFDILRQILGEYVDDAREKYQFTWNGKGKALHISQTPSLGTLRPCHEKSKNWDSTENLYIEGDNLEVLKILQRSYHRAIKMIYIDPPYNTGHDFVYKDDFKDNIENYKQVTGQVDAEGRALSANTESGGRYHTNWLNMMYPRLRLARNLLADDGVIFISIDDHEVGNLRHICDEIFGDKNYFGDLIWESTTQPTNAGNAKFGLQKKTETILMYGKNKFDIKGFNLHILNKSLNYPHQGKYGACRFEIIEKSDAGTYNRDTMKFKILGHEPRKGKRWQIGEETARKLEREGKLEIIDGIIKRAVYPEDEVDKIQYKPFWSLLGAKEYGTAQTGKDELNSLMETEIGFDTVKPVTLIKELLFHLGKEYTILDFFSGTGTTAESLLRLNLEDKGHRKFIMVQLPEVLDEKTEAHMAGYKTICDIGEERIRRAGALIEKEAEEKNQEVPDTGFKVFQLDSSNIKRWNPDKKDLAQSLWDYVDNFVEGRTEEDVVYEIMLKTGIDLSCPVEKLERNGHTIYSIGMGALFICLDDHVNEDVAKVLTVLHQELSPETWKVVFRDNAFDRDADKTNVREMLKCEGLDPVDFLTI